MLVHHSESRPDVANYEVHLLVGFYSSFFTITQALCFARGMGLSLILVAYPFFRTIISPLEQQE